MSFVLKTVAAFGLVSFAAAQISVSISAGTCSTSSVDTNDFGYEPENGPQNWHITVPGSQLCKTGRNQSPILLDSSVRRVGPGVATLTVNQGSGQILLENKGNAVEVVGVNAEIIINAEGGRRRKLVNYHFHTPSEHRVNLEYSPVELHLVTEDENGKLAVFGILVELVATKLRSSPFIQSTLAFLSCVSQPGTKTPISLPPFAEIQAIFREKVFYNYPGSLTTPPCSEGVDWYVSTEKIFLDLDNYKSLKDVLNFNSRFSQSDPGQQNVLEFSCSA